MTFHFRQMLVIQTQTISAERQIGFRRKALDQRLAATGIARHRVHHIGPVCRQQSAGDQRRDQRQKAGRIATGVGDKARIGDCLTLTGAKFGKAIGPALGRAVRGRGIDDPRAVIVDHRHRFDRRIIGQAEDDKITLVDRSPPRRRILAVRFRQLDQRKFFPPGQPLGNFQPGRAHGTVDKDRLRHSQPQDSRLRASTG